MEDLILIRYKMDYWEWNKKIKGVNFKVFEYELEEPRSDDIKYISKYKSVDSMGEFSKWYTEHN